MLSSTVSRNLQSLSFIGLARVRWYVQALCKYSYRLFAFYNVGVPLKAPWHQYAQKMVFDMPKRYAQKIVKNGLVHFWTLTIL